MKEFVAIGFALFLPFALSSRASGQSQNSEWIEISPTGESFHALMPNQAREHAEVGAVTGKKYETTIGVANYTIWSLTNANYRSSGELDLDLDACAELVWEGLLKPARENLDEKGRRFARMTYVRELPREGLSGREYQVTMGDVTGTVEFFVARQHIYVMLAVGKPGGDWLREKFFASFRTSSTRLETSALLSGALGAGSGEATPSETDRVFSGRDITTKARILEMPEPTYTESARKFGVTGTVVLRGVFSKNGKVTNLSVMKRLPHGLTQRAITAARAIRFTQAIKDGQPASMWMELQYNFNLY